MPHGIIAEDILQRDHAVERGAENKAIDIALGAFDGDLLTVALKLEDADLGELGASVRVVRAIKARHMGFGVGKLNFVFILIDGAQDRAFANFNLRFFEIGIGGGKFGAAFLDVADVLGAFLFYLVRQIVEFSVGLASGADFRCGVELGNKFAGMDALRRSG